MPGVPGVPGTPMLGVPVSQRVGLTVTRGCSSKKAPCMIGEGKRTHQVCRVILVRQAFQESLRNNGHQPSRPGKCTITRGPFEKSHEIVHPANRKR